VQALASSSKRMVGVSSGSLNSHDALSMNLDWTRPIIASFGSTIYTNPDSQPLPEGARNQPKES
jgi:hypothetical protein